VVTRVLALDVGSSSVRARAYDERGMHVDAAEAQTKYEDADPKTLVEATRSTLDEARRDAGECDAVAASCFWHSLVAVDGQSRPLTALLTWRDQRAAGQARALATRLDLDEVHARTGCVVHPSYWPAKLAWLHEEEPEIFSSADRFLSFSDYLYGELVGDTSTSLSMASGTGLLDLNTRAWDEELLEALELSPERLPEISDEPAGTDEPWFTALGDGACSNLGAGCTTRDRAALMIGTSGAYRVLYEAASAEPKPGLFCYRLDDRRLVEGGALSDGGNLYAWLERTLADAEVEGVAELEPARHGLTFLPLLGGERSPGWRTDARGAVAGLTFETTAQDLVQAALEGVAYRFAEIAELVPGITEIVATGAALLADPDWIQIVADVLEQPVVASAVDEGSARGAAVAALERLGVDPEPAPLGKRYEPRADRSAAHREARERQRRLYETLA
jgi:gluconokinase